MSVLTRQRVSGDGVEPREADESPQVPCFALAGLLGDLGQHPELDLDTLTYHVRQSDATAADGYWHASINEARSFLEALIVSIAVARQDGAIGSRKSVPTTPP